MKSSELNARIVSQENHAIDRFFSPLCVWQRNWSRKFQMEIERKEKSQLV